MEKLKDELIPSLASGTIGALAASFLLGVDLSAQFSLGSYNMPAYLAIGGSITAADLIAYASHDYVLEKIPMLQGFATYENKLLAPVLSGAATYALFRTTISSDASFTNSFILGAGSTIAGTYTSETLKSINPSLQENLQYFLLLNYYYQILYLIFLSFYNELHSNIYHHIFS